MPLYLECFVQNDPFMTKLNKGLSIYPSLAHSVIALEDALSISMLMNDE